MGCFFLKLWFVSPLLKMLAFAAWNCCKTANTKCKMEMTVTRTLLHAPSPMCTMNFLDYKVSICWVFQKSVFQRLSCVQFSSLIPLYQDIWWYVIYKDSTPNRPENNGNGGFSRTCWKPSWSISLLIVFFWTNLLAGSLLRPQYGLNNFCWSLDPVVDGDRTSV